MDCADALDELARESQSGFGIVWHIIAEWHTRFETVSNEGPGRSEPRAYIARKAGERTADEPAYPSNSRVMATSHAALVPRLMLGQVLTVISLPSASRPT